MIWCWCWHLIWWYSTAFLVSLWVYCELTILVQPHSDAGIRNIVLCQYHSSNLPSHQKLPVTAILFIDFIMAFAMKRIFSITLKPEIYFIWWIVFSCCQNVAIPSSALVTAWFVDLQVALLVYSVLVGYEMMAIITSSVGSHSSYYLRLMICRAICFSNNWWWAV